MSTASPKKVQEPVVATKPSSPQKPPGLDVPADAAAAPAAAPVVKQPAPGLVTPPPAISAPSPKNQPSVPVLGEASAATAAGANNNNTAAATAAANNNNNSANCQQQQAPAPAPGLMPNANNAQYYQNHYAMFHQQQQNGGAAPGTMGPGGNNNNMNNNNAGNNNNQENVNPNAHNQGYNTNNGAQRYNAQNRHTYHSGQNNNGPNAMGDRRNTMHGNGSKPTGYQNNGYNTQAGGGGGSYHENSRNGGSANDDRKRQNGVPAKKSTYKYVPGDWICPTCEDLQFRRNKFCRICNTMNPMVLAQELAIAAGVSNNGMYGAAAFPGATNPPGADMADMSGGKGGFDASTANDDRTQRNFSNASFDAAFEQGFEGFESSGQKGKGKGGKGKEGQGDKAVADMVFKRIMFDAASTANFIQPQMQGFNQANNFFPNANMLIPNMAGVDPSYFNAAAFMNQHGINSYSLGLNSMGLSSMISPFAGAAGGGGGGMDHFSNGWGNDSYPNAYNSPSDYSNLQQMAGMQQQNGMCSNSQQQQQQQQQQQVMNMQQQGNQQAVAAGGKGGRRQ